MQGVKPVVVALILSTGCMLLLKTIGYVGLQKFRVDVVSVVILVLLVGIYFGITRFWKKKLSAVKIILLSAGLGVAVSMVAEAVSI